ncbi:uncharacterized protein LOC133657228 isoform X2 [Entelurus aequoreus]|uniref:uncharacterized protein LOC133657228 isoform X2 n=1 Tax=Entelurus aequoreus TaxID=161455 RepID=UPI002B1D0290|nr:uncharacterized protein LOC133657228 isoform X2 [Entelurus aequoreus]XP_061914291.1 uncharacterized protein LOC133657228 isoform X2 [Entelurus aequoreus]
MQHRTVKASSFQNNMHTVKASSLQLPAGTVNTTQDRERYSPFRLMFGREARMFTEVTTECPEVMAAPDQADSLEAFVQLRVGQDEDVFGKVINNVERAQERQKLDEEGVKRFIIQPGMEVLKKDARKKGRPGRTMDPNWSQTIYRRSHARPRGMTVVFSCSCTPSGSVRTLLFTTVCWTCSQSGVGGVSF